MPLSSAEIKRQILMSASSSPIRKKLEQVPPGISEGDIVEIGNDLEELTKRRGWTWVESYMLRRMDLVGLAMSDQASQDQKGIARGFIELMQWVHLSIKKRDEILEKEKSKYASQNVSKEEKEQGVGHSEV